MKMEQYYYESIHDLGLTENADSVVYTLENVLPLTQVLSKEFQFKNRSDCFIFHVLRCSFIYIIKITTTTTILYAISNNIFKYYLSFKTPHKLRSMRHTRLLLPGQMI